MDRFRTKLKTGQELQPVTWLADEILWGIVKVPFNERWKNQWTSPLENDEIRIMNSLWNQASQSYVNARSDDPEMLSKAAWNIGKLAAGATSHVVHFEANPLRWRNSASDFVEDAKHAVSRVVGSIKENTPWVDLSSQAGGDDFENRVIALEDRVRDIAWESVGRMPSRHQNGEKLDRLAVDAFYLAQAGVVTWLSFIRAHDGKFQMELGGIPRSSGDFISVKMEEFQGIHRPWAPNS